ncbi:MAG: hypothetical protein HZB56_01150 [Deltaproteobacteria bacterium]|nr:hypothetical protein [Deltaproteobacteria bacterium]
MPRTIVALAAVALLVACGARKSGQVTVSAASTAATGGSTTTPPPAPAALPAGVRITEVNVAVRELELSDGTCASSGDGSKVSQASRDSSGPGDSSGGHDGSDDGECEAEVGPFIAHLDAAALADLAAGRVPQVWSAPLRAGTYSELEVQLCAVDPASLADEAQAALATAMQGATVVVKGTYQPQGAESAAPFTISVSACAELERHVRITVDDQGAVSNLTVSLPLGNWFRDAAGNPIDPTTDAGAAAIAAGIAASLDVCGDDDRDGHSDD